MASQPTEKSTIQLPKQHVAVWAKKKKNKKKELEPALNFEDDDGEFTDMVCCADYLDDHAELWQKLKTKCEPILQKQMAFRPRAHKKGGKFKTPSEYSEKEGGSFKLLRWLSVDDKGNIAIPQGAAGVKLSDDAAYLALKTLTRDDRAQRFPADFDKYGNLRVERAPQDPPPLFFVNGMPCLVAWKGYHLLTGETLAHLAGSWLLAEKQDPGWSLKCGVLFLHKDLWETLEMMRAPIRIIRQIHHNDGKLVDTVYKSNSPAPPVDDAPIAHIDCVGLLGLEGVSWHPMWQLGGYDPRFSGHPESSRISKEYFDRHCLDIDYDKIVGRPYQNVKGTWLRDVAEFPKFVDPEVSETLKDYGFDDATKALMQKSDTFENIVTNISEKIKCRQKIIDLNNSIKQDLVKLGGERRPKFHKRARELWRDTLPRKRPASQSP